MSVAVIRIKKKYFDLIKSGEKKFEYRKDSKYYNNIFNKKPTFIVFHFQTKDRLMVEIKEINKVKKPEFLIDCPYLPTDKIYKITLGSVIAT